MNHLPLTKMQKNPNFKRKKLALPTMKHEPMSTTHKTALTKCHVMIVDALDVKHIIHDLIAAQILTDHMADDIKSRPTRREKAEAMLDIVKRSSENAYEAFTHSLRTRGYRHLTKALASKVDEIEKEQIPNTDYIYGNLEPGDIDDYFEVYVTNSEEIDKDSNLPPDDTSNFLGEVTKTVECFRIDPIEIPRNIIPPKSKSCPLYATHIFMAYTELEQTTRESIQLNKGELIYVDTRAVKDEEPGGYQVLKLHEIIKDILVAYDMNGNAFFLHDKSLAKDINDPDGEPWFFPNPITSHEATIILEKRGQEGLFVVYRNKNQRKDSQFNLSVFTRQGKARVLNYHILTDKNDGRYFIPFQGNEKEAERGQASSSFSCLSSLIKHYKQNKGGLVTRLRRPLNHALQEARDIIPYEERWEISPSDVDFIRNIGSGNFGKVDIVQGSGGYFARKTLLKDQLHIHEVDDFLTEACILMKIKGLGNVLELKGVSFQEIPYAVFTRYYGRGSLINMLRQPSFNSPSRQDKIRRYLLFCIDITKAMKHLTDMHFIIHRDLAARNILVADNDQMVLSDFGKAVYVEEDSYRGSSSEKVPIRSASPEVITDKMYSTKSDVWAFGVLMWEIFSNGSVPYSKKSIPEIREGIKKGGQVGKPLVYSEVVYSIMQKCWLLNPEMRPTFDELYHDLTSAVERYPTNVKMAAQNKMASDVNSECNNQRWYHRLFCCINTSTRSTQRSTLLATDVHSGQQGHLQTYNALQMETNCEGYEIPQALSLPTSNEQIDAQQEPYYVNSSQVTKSTTTCEDPGYLTIDDEELDDM